MSKKKHRKNSGIAAAGPVAGSEQKKVNHARGINSMTNWLILLLIFIPVLFSVKTMDPNITVRYICTGVILTGMAIYFFGIRKMSFQWPQSLLTKLVFGTAIAFAAWSMLSMFSAINYREGYFEIGRHLLNIILLFFIMTAVSNEESQILKLCKVVVLVSVIQSFVGILQFYGLAFTELPGANDKPFGLMSNRNLFGSAQAFMLPFVVYTIYRSGKFWRTTGIAALILVIISLLISQTRSAWIAAAAFFLVSFFLVLLFSPQNRKKWIIGSLATVLATAGIVFVVLSSDQEGSLTQSVKERTQSFTQTNNAGTESVANAQERFKIWNKTLKLISDKPITGAGPGNWKINIPAYGTDGLVWAYGKFAPDRPHNVYLLIASETGIPGAVLYFGMWLIIAVIACKVIFKPQTEDQRILNIIMLAGLAAFACDSMLSFPTERIEHTLYIMLMGGIILGSYKTGNAGPGKKIVNKPMLALILAVLIFNMYIGNKKYNYEVHLNRAKAYENINKYNEMLAEAEAGKSDLITMGPETGITLQLKSSIALKELKQYDKALKEINIAKSYNPNNANIWSTMGTIYTDMKQYDKAIPCYEKALEFTPHYDIVLKNLSVNYFMTNNFEACILTLNKLNLEGDTYLTGMLNEAKRRLAENK